jgi:hypothetical protein
MEFAADSEGLIRKGSNSAEDDAIQTKAQKIWTSASHCHFNRDFQFNAESTAIQFTNHPTIGGRAWPGIVLNNLNSEKALTLWGNSTLGILLHWWHSNKQQAGRGSIGISALESLMVLDVNKLTEDVLVKATGIFDDLKYRELKPVNEICDDATRHEIDERLYGEILGFPKEILSIDGPLALLRQKLALEPSINGGKPPR